MSYDLRSAAVGPLASRLSVRYLEQHSLIPLSEENGVVIAAVGEVPDETVVDELVRLFGRPVRLVDYPAGEIQAALLSARRDTPAVSLGVVGGDEAGLGDLRALANQAPVIQLVNVTLLDALRDGASDVHLETTTAGLRVRVRLDGVLRDVQVLARQFAAGVISRVKLLAGLDIAERRLPQDGRARLQLADREVDLRVSTLPAMHGESVVIRLLDHGASARMLPELGMPSEMRARFEKLVRRPNGLILVTGPTGSGKTTTLYAALSRVNAPGVKVVTVEDPVEYQIDGVTQIPVNRKAGLGFPNALRSILRHDPDVVMVGEMRDLETAEIAIQASLTGHLVFSTLHTNDAPGGFTRLVDMGVEPYLVAATVQAIVAQRLVRMLCSECAEPYEPTLAELARAPQSGNGDMQVAARPQNDLMAHAGRGGEVDTLATYRRPIGCGSCARSGFRGRTGIYELVVPSESVRARLVAGASLDELRAIARADGSSTLHEAGWAAARAGITTIDEILRVTSEDGG